MDFFYAQRCGVYPMDVISPDVVPGPPGFRLFIDDLVGRFADALTDAPTDTWPKEFPQTLARLAREKGHDLPMVQSVAEQSPLMLDAYPDGWRFNEGEVLENTQDPTLAAAVENAEAGGIEKRLIHDAHRPEGPQAGH